MKVDLPCGNITGSPYEVFSRSLDAVDRGILNGCTSANGTISMSAQTEAILKDYPYRLNRRKISRFFLHYFGSVFFKNDPFSSRFEHCVDINDADGKPIFNPVIAFGLAGKPKGALSRGRLNVLTQRGENVFLKGGVLFIQASYDTTIKNGVELIRVHVPCRIADIGNQSFFDIHPSKICEEKHDESWWRCWKEVYSGTVS